MAAGSVSTKFADKMMNQNITPNVNFAIGQSSLITPAPACHGDEDQSTILFESMHGGQTDKACLPKDFKMEMSNRFKSDMSQQKPSLCKGDKLDEDQVIGH